MACPACDNPTVSFAVPEEYSDLVDSGASYASLCTRCLTLSDADSSPDDNPEFGRISSAFPGGQGAVEIALLVGSLDELAPNRESIEELVLAAETAGTDPLLVLDRLDADEDVEPTFDLGRRIHQLRQLL